MPSGIAFGTMMHQQQEQILEWQTKYKSRNDKRNEMEIVIVTDK